VVNARTKVQTFSLKLQIFGWEIFKEFLFSSNYNACEAENVQGLPALRSRKKASLMPD